MFMHSFTTHLQEEANDHPFRKNQSTFDESQKSGRYPYPLESIFRRIHNYMIIREVISTPTDG